MEDSEEPKKEEIKLFILKQYMPFCWAIYAPKGHIISDSFRGNKLAAVEWGNAWITSFQAASLKVEE